MYYVLPLTSKEISKGTLFQILDALTGQSDASIKRALAGRDGRERKIIESFFDNSSTNPDFHEQWGDVQDVLYLNEVAYELLKGAGIVPADLAQRELSETVGRHLYLPIYV